MDNLVRRLVTGALLAFACLAGQAQPYPSKPIRLVVPFPAAGTADIAARTVAQALSQGLGQQIVVDNRGGADGAIAANAVTGSPPDGYTLFFATTTALNAAPTLRKTAPYDPLDRLHPDLAGGQVRLLPDGARERAGEDRSRAAGSRAGQSRQGQLWNRQRHQHSHHGATRSGGKARDDAHPVQGRRTGVGRPDRRPGPADDRHPFRRRAAADQGGPPARARHAPAQSQPAVARITDRLGSGLAQPDDHALGRTVRPARHAQGRGRTACQRNADRCSASRCARGARPHRLRVAGIDARGDVGIAG